MTGKVVVIGAGVVGLSVALAAQARGFAVQVVDREGPAAGASAGNAGAFAFTDILPLASPRIMRQAPKWLLDPLGPLTVPPSYALRIAPWMLRFWRACSPARVRASTAAQTALMDLSKAELEPFLAATGTLPMLRKEGNLQVYESQAEFDASLPGWRAREEHGIAFRHMAADEMAGVQPGLAPRFTHGTFTPGWYSIADPRDYTLALADRFRARGGEIVIAEATGLADDGVLTALGKLTGRVVLAAGAFSHLLARTLGVRIPLETERGYNTTLPADAFDLRCQVTFGGHGFVITKLSSGIRVGGAVELGGLKLPPNYRRSEAMLKKAKAFLPGLRTTGGQQWMGFRPSLPDSLPAIGPLPGHPNVVCAFGHGHLGLTQSAGTARIVAGLLAGEDPGIDLAPFSPARF
ncbi:NAD(P)/FAD-dependent oxidoreductase [Paracoccus denitrificans]|jgi:D-amino-acid dehydrogenase|uniref:D-amino acid dehydrogenase small subunit n=1 Tax=Paracoccus denitrificans (strain Pd 1222) TaxID=318586 RepID=A1BBM6_PARDP|nr:FAD-dependent oxidoreductase [Paracoccus denitrificans]ABL72920.1 D-amino acid dehydrogenase small subunit [Paracoccus denitrificans PD1222]MBB4626399.1 D-amino-acid dehydrogenase [Paracoccus denitrificans]MCU7427397.1 FAD-dependent oxidoreductase [Paracoccus denitrificans]QAR29323.1 FAD-dependent oxidoreductase [Paracoccus denitrificans]UPV98348.1 FAD-dependent oxidoreductase [Paracoccus denitrificans]